MSNRIRIFILPILVSLFTPRAGFSTVLNNTLQGTVYDSASHQPLTGTTIYIPELKTGAATDAQGHFSIGYLPKGSVLVEVRYLGYKTITMNVKVQGNTTVNFAMVPSAVEQHEVVVTGLSNATTANRNPVPIIAIPKQYIQQTLHTNIIDAIADVPGVSAVTTGPNVSKPFIHGLGFNQVLTLYDGQRQEENQWGDEHGIGVDQYGIDRIEVVEGPASLVYGSDALAGVVNLIPTPPAPDGKTIGNVTAEYQTNNGLFGGSAMLSGNHKGFYWLGRISHKEAKNYRDKIDGWVYGTGYRETDASGSFGINRGWGYAHLDLTLFDDLQAIPDGSRDSASRRFTKQITEADDFRPIVPYSELHSYKLPVLHQHVQHYRIYSSNHVDLGQGGMDINLGFERSVRREYSHPEAGSAPGLDLQLNTYTYGLKYNLPEWRDWNVTAGINGMYQINTSTHGTEFIIPNYHELDLGPFLMIKKSLGKLDLAGGARYDFRYFRNEELYTKPDPETGFDVPVSGKDTVGADQPFSRYTHHFSGASASLGLTYNISEKSAVKFNIARGYRAPNISEISANGVHPGTNIYQIGNGSLKPEFDLQEDLGFTYRSDKLSLKADLFNNDISNYIFNQRVASADGGDSVIVPGNQTFKFQQVHARLYGGSVDLDIHFLKWLHFENTLSVVYGVNKGGTGEPVSDSSRYLPYIAPLHTVTELRAEMQGTHGHLAHGFAKLQMEVYGDQDRAYLAYNTETPTPGYTLFNAGLGADIVNAKGKTLFNVSVLAKNIFNAAYQSHLSRLKYFEEYPDDPRGHLGIYDMGTNVGVKVSVPLDLQ